MLNKVVFDFLLLKDYSISAHVHCFLPYAVIIVIFYLIISVAMNSLLVLDILTALGGFISLLFCIIQDEEIRNRFFKVFDAQVSRRLYERLYHIVALQNWGDMYDTFWIKHCINVGYAFIH